MNDARKSQRKNGRKGYAGKDILHNIEQTLAELEVYLEDNPDDEIAQVQYRQYLSKKEDYQQLLADRFGDGSDLEQHA
ncbi:hypothetical protein [Paenibacillus harenae]|uniref:hypothetical protein n=1 Tax=Paenibacillus harenae TaxID=306543 RepID=UPI0003F862AC|nr:hypothetical protein [Paenibacillus harenae]